MLTLNQIIDQIKTLANAHYQIAEVGVGTIAELQAKPDRSYPLLWLSNEGGTLDNNYKVDNIRLTMFGRVTVGDEGQDDDASELEVLSDMQLILLDFLNYFHQNHGQDYVTDKSNTLEHFTERTNDRTAGYSTVLELKQFYDWNKCRIPQSGASIPPTVDGLTLYDFCDADVIARLTPTQTACLEAELCGACDDATVQLNGSTIGTIASGATGDFDVLQGGSPVGSWNGSEWVIPSCDPIPSITVGIYSDPTFTTPITAENLGETAYVKAVATDFTPIDYLFFYECQMNELYPIYHGANDNSSWVIDGAIGSGSLFGAATDDGDTWYMFRIDFEIEGVVRLLNNYPDFLNFSSLISRSATFTDPLVAVRRVNDNETADFTPSTSVDPPIIDLDSIASNATDGALNGLTLTQFATTNSGDTPAFYDQTGNSVDLIENVAADQPIIVDSGAMISSNGFNYIESNGTTHHLAGWVNTVAPLAFQGLSSAISFIWKGEFNSAPTGGNFSNWRPRDVICEFRKNSAAPYAVPFCFGVTNNRFALGFCEGAVANVDTFTSTLNPSTGVAYTVIVTIDGNTVNIYINGSLDSTHTIVNATGDRSVGTSKSSLTLFERTTDAGSYALALFGGYTSDFGVIDTVLTPAEVSDIYTNYLS